MVIRHFFQISSIISAGAAMAACVSGDPNGAEFALAEAAGRDSRWTPYLPASLVSSAQPFLALPRESVLPKTGSGPVWQPFLLTKEARYLVTERDLLAGVLLGNERQIEAPKPGECLAWESSMTPPASGGGGGAEGFKLKLHTGPGSAGVEREAGQLLWFLEPGSGALQGLASVGKEDSLSCPAALLNSAVSSGSGRARRFLPTSRAETGEVELRLPARAHVRVGLQRQSGIQLGDRIRVGRVAVPLQSVPVAGEAAALQALLVRDLPGRPLYAPSRYPDRNLGVRETMVTTFLAGESPFALALEPGSYRFAILRQSMEPVCVVEMELAPGQEKDLECPFLLSVTRELNDRAAEPQVWTWDSTRLPTSLLRDADFQKWLSAQPQSLFFTSDEDAARAQVFDFNLLVPSFTPRDPNLPGGLLSLGPLRGRFSPGQESPERRERVWQRVLQASTRSIHRDVHAVDPLLAAPPLDPLAGTGERELAEGAVLFGTRNQVRLSPVRAERNEILAGALIATNGASLSWVDPAPESIGASVRAPLQHRIKARLVVPSWNATEFVEMNVNGQTYRRWVLPPAADQAKPRQFEIDERVDVEGDFYVSLQAWGQRYLPELLYGVGELQPFCVTRPICIDGNDNGRCDVAFSKGGEKHGSGSEAGGTR